MPVTQPWPLYPPSPIKFLKRWTSRRSRKSSSHFPVLQAHAHLPVHLHPYNLCSRRQIQAQSPMHNRKLARYPCRLTLARGTRAIVHLHLVPEAGSSICPLQKALMLHGTCSHHPEASFPIQQYPLVHLSVKIPTPMLVLPHPPVRRRKRSCGRR